MNTLDQILNAVVVVNKRDSETGEVKETLSSVNEVIHHPENYRLTDVLRASLVLVDLAPSVELDAGMVEDLRLLAVKIASTKLP